MRIIYTLLFTLAGLAGMAQTNQPLPPDAQPLTALTYLSPSDSTVWLYNERSSLAINVGVWADVVELFETGWSNTQIDSAITANLAGYVPTSRTINGKALTGNITLNADDVGASQPGDNVSDFVNDAGYITAGDIPADAVTSVNGMTGAVTVDKADIGLGNVDNTSDANKPISTATASALAGKENAFSKGNLVQGTGVTLSGTLANRLVGSGNVTINATGTSQNLSVSGSNLSISGGNTVSLGALNRSNPSWDSALGGTTFFPIYSSVGSPLPGSNTHGINIPHTSGFGTRLAFRDNQAWISSVESGVVRPWVELWHSGNFTPPVGFTRSVTGLVPAPGGSGTTRYLREDGTWVDPSTGGGGGTATDLSIQNRTSTTLQVGSSTGSAATIPEATASLSGLLSATQYGRIQNGQTAYGWGNHAAAGYWVNSASGAWNGAESNNTFRTVVSLTDAPTGIGNFAGFSMAFSGGNYATQFAGRNDLFYIRSLENGSYLPWRQIWHSGNFNPDNYLTTSYVPAWSSITGKPSTFAPSPHNHNASDINAGTLAIARIPTGTTGSTVALGNHTHTFAQITSKPTTLSGYGITDAVPSSRNINTSMHLTGGGALSSNITIGLTPMVGNYVVDSEGNPRIYLGGAADTYATRIRASAAAQLFTWATSTNSTVAAIDATTGAIMSASLTGGGDKMLVGTSSGTIEPRAASSVRSLLNVTESGTGSTQVRNNSQLDARYLQSSDLSGYVPTTRTINGKALSANVTLTNADIGSEPAFSKNTAFNKNFGTAAGTVAQGNDSRIVNAAQRNATNTFSAANTFSQPVTVANATNSNHAVTLGQVNSLVPESPDWTQYGTGFDVQGRQFPGSGYYDVGVIESLGFRYWANVLANSFVNEGDMVEVDGVFEVDMSSSTGAGPRLTVLGNQFVLPVGINYSQNIYDVNIRFRYSTSNLMTCVIKVQYKTVTSAMNMVIHRSSQSSFNTANNILIPLEVDTESGITSQRVKLHEVRVTKYSSKYSN